MSTRSKRYRAIAQKVEPNKQYSLDDAIALIQATATTKFDSGVELHMKLGIDPKKGEEQVRGTIVLPHGTGKIVRIAAFTKNPEAAKKAGADIVGSEDLIKEIQTTKKADFDIAIAEPEMMKLMAPIAKILGSQGLMPSPKNETVTSDVAKAVEAFKKGKLAFKNDDTGNIHILVGKVSYTTAQLKENIETFMDSIKRSRPQATKGVFIQSITISSSMGPGVRVTI